MVVAVLQCVCVCACVCVCVCVCERERVCVDKCNLSVWCKDTGGRVSGGVTRSTRLVSRARTQRAPSTPFRYTSPPSLCVRMKCMCACMHPYLYVFIFIYACTWVCGDVVMQMLCTERLLCMERLSCMERLLCMECLLCMERHLCIEVQFAAIS